MKVVIVNDTSGPHVGCQLVLEAYRYQLDRVGIELLGTVPKSTKKIERYPDFIRRADLVIVNGEGSIHHGQRQELVTLATYFPSVLVNCVYQDNPKNSALKKFKLVASRESKSAAELAAHGVNAEVVPDVMLTAPSLVSFERPSASDDLGVTDSVLKPDEGISALVGEGNCRQYFERLSRYRRLSIGRFHGVLIAASLGIPFSAWASNTHKTEALMQDMGAARFFASEREDAIRLAPHSLPQSISDYVERGRARVDRLFERLESLA